MSVDKYHNQQYSGSPPDVPLRTGDRRYAQDRVLDFWFLMDSVGKVLDDMMGQLPILLSGGVVTQGAGQSLDITAGYGYAEFNVDIPLSFASTPPTKTNADLEAIKISWGAQNDINASSANCSVYTVVDDGVTTNYVKMTYLETDGNTRNRAKATGSYAYEVAPDFDLIVNGSAPGDNEILLATFTSSGGTYTITTSTTHVLDYTTINDINVRINSGISTLSKSSDYTITDGDLEGVDHLIVYVDTSNGEVIITLPTLSDNQKKKISIVSTDIGLKVVVKGEGSETIGGFSRIYLEEKSDSIEIIGETGEWQILNNRGSFEIGWASPELVGTGFNIAGIGTVALTALNQRDVAFIDSTLDNLRTYRFDGNTWSLVGAGLAIAGSGLPSVTAINSTDIAFLDSSNKDLRTYRFNGTNWSQVGLNLNIPGLSITAPPALAALYTGGTYKDIAFMDSSNEDLRTYRFDGTNWSQVGSDLNIPGAGTLELAALNGTDVAFIDNTLESLRLYRFNGSTWSLVGSGLSITGIGSPALTALNGTDIVFIDATLSSLRIYRFNGSTWSQIGTELSLSGKGSSDIATLNGSTIAYIDTTIEDLEAYRFNFTPK